MKLNLFTLGMFIAAVSVIFMGCLHEDEDSSLANNLMATEAELSTVRGELRTVQGELSTVQGDLSDAQAALSECQDTGLGVLKIENDSPNAVHYVYISPTTSDTWGNDWMEEFDGGVISTGYSQYFVLDPGTYDLLVEFSNGQEFESVITISPGEITKKRYIPAN